MQTAATGKESEREIGTQDVWRTSAASLYQGGLGSDIWLVEGRAVPVSRHRSQVAMICGRASATFAQQEARVAQALPALEMDEIRASLLWLAECGILRTTRQLSEDLQRVGRKSPSLQPQPDIGTLGIITANRPQALRYCAQSFLAHFHQHGHDDLKYVIADDSRSSEDLSANSLLCNQLRASTGRPLVIHLASCNKAKLRRQLIRQGIPRETAEFALPIAGEQFCGPGANRNWILALFAGEKLLSVDDDTVCRLWQHPEARDAVRLNGHDDPCDYWFPLSRGDASQTPVTKNADLLRSHGQLLGKRVTEVTAAALETRNGCAHLLPARGKLEAQVALTYTGLAGDSGMFSGMRFLMCQGETRARLAADRALYNRAIGRREIARIAPCATITHDQICMTTTLGIDNRETLPPFPPGWRGEDKVFGSALALLYPHSVTADVPLGIVHNADRPDSYTLSIFEAVTVSRVCDLLVALTASMVIPNQYSTAARWRMLSEYFLEAANSSPDAFRDFLLRAWVESGMKTIRLLERHRAEFAYPTYWVDDIDRYCRSLLDSLPEFFHRGPAEFRDRGSSADEAFSQFQRLCRDMAGLFGCWGTICEAAKQLRFADLPDLNA